MLDMEQVGPRARAAAAALAVLPTARKNEILRAIAAGLGEERGRIMAVNAQEVDAAAAAGLPAALCDRLRLTPARFDEMQSGVLQVAALPDPIGEVLGGRTVESGLRVVRERVPLGVVGTIYEARPNVTVDIAALCLKSGNACVLRGGREALQTNLALDAVMQRAIAGVAGLDPALGGAVTLVKGTDRADVTALLRADRYVDVIIPRGGQSLYERCQKEATVPLIEGGFGISHIFVDDSADLRRAVGVILNAKLQKPSACNALDTLLLTPAAARGLLPLLLPDLGRAGVRVHAHGEALALCAGYPVLEEGVAADLDREFLALEMNVCLVADTAAALLHLRRHGARHSDAILTDSESHARMFVAGAPSACVYVNASTRFTDGGQFGLGAEVAISTQRLHARGPLGLEALTTYRYVCGGDYLSRA